MKELEYNGNIFLLPNPQKRDACLVTTNGIIRNDGNAVMGAGIAKYCRDTFKGVDKILGQKLKDTGNHVYNLGWCHIPYENDRFGIFLLYSFPTKDDWREDSKLELIRQSCREIMKAVDEDMLNNIYMPCPGCSNGKLNYWKDVRNILIKELDDRFIVCIPDKIKQKR